jgi:hypothetical protein
MTAPIASGWSDCRVGLAPTGKRRLCTAHARSGHVVGGLTGQDKAGAVRAKGAEFAFHFLGANMRKALMVMLSITVAVIVTSQADAKGNKVSMGMIKFTKHYDKSSPGEALPLPGVVALVIQVLLPDVVRHA